MQGQPRAAVNELVARGVEALFPTPLLSFELAAASSLNEALRAEAERRRRSDPPVAQRSNLGGWHSADDLFDRAEPPCRELCGQLLRATAHATLQMAPTFDVAGHAMQAEGWFNMLDPGGVNAPHDHPGWVWSGVYYVHVPEGGGDGAIEFLDSRTNLRVMGLPGATFDAPKYAVAPQTGRLLLFPSFLRHWVRPWAGSGCRVAVAFNVRFVRQPR
jgi:uncharacterized protein (TIGR02466 family)